MFFILSKVLATFVGVVIVYSMSRNLMIARQKTEKELFSDIKGWPKYANRDIKIYIQPDKNTSIHEPREVCTDSNAPKNSLFLLVVVNSAIENFKLRRIIRGLYDKRNYEHFHSYMNFSFKVVFNLGLQEDGHVYRYQGLIDMEVKLYGDIIQENFVDTYYNLSLKTAMMLKWVTRKCGDTVRYILKSDDDVTIYLDYLLKELYIKAEKFDESQRNQSLLSGEKNIEEFVLSGSLCCTCEVIRKPRNKWFCPKYMYSLDHYPCFLLGSHGFLLSAPTARVLYEAALKTPVFHLEDVYITGFARENAVPNLTATNEVFIWPNVY